MAGAPTAALSGSSMAHHLRYDLFIRASNTAITYSTMMSVTQLIDKPGDARWTCERTPRFSGPTGCALLLHLAPCLGVLPENMDDYVYVCQRGRFCEALAQAWGMPYNPATKGRVTFLAFKSVECVARPDSILMGSRSGLPPCHPSRHRLRLLVKAANVL
jgi:hypothetical protein